MTISIPMAVDRLFEARSHRRALSPLSAMDEGLTIPRAYAIQDALRLALISQGRRAIGWKLAATGPTGQAVLGIKEPIHGFLWPTVFVSGDTVSLRAFVKAGAEAEIAFRMGSPLRGPGVTATTAMRAVKGIMPALELPDMMLPGAPHVSDVIANAALAQAIVLGDEFTPPAGFDLAAEVVTTTHNGTPVGTNLASELMGNPLNGLALLANHLAERGLGLEAGDIVMSGGISPLLFPGEGDTVSATFSRLGLVAARFVA